jgi:hypothetical protein
VVASQEKVITTLTILPLSGTLANAQVSSRCGYSTGLGPVPICA